MVTHSYFLLASMISPLLMIACVLFEQLLNKEGILGLHEKKVEKKQLLPCYIRL